jgi:SAM-dependent methyltransferase
MDFELLKRNWEAFGRDDPLWAVLTEPSRRGGLWDPDEFLATGEQEIGELFAELDACGIALDKGRALDFGCGAGRLTQALADWFQQCDGVDIAASMIAEAERLNRHGERVSYHVNPSADLALFGGETFDFVLSYIVLQHMEPRYAKRYIAEFVRVLKVGAVGVFSLPTGRSTPVAPPADATPPLALPDPAPLDHMAPSPDNPDAPVMEMYGIAPDEVEAVLTAAGARIERRISDSRGGPAVEGFRYVIRRVNERVPPLPRAALGYLEQALQAVPDRPDKFPPAITRRRGRVGRLELEIRRALARVLRPITWVQTEYDREMLRALVEAREALGEQDAELRRLDREVERLKAQRRRDENSGRTD